jgi:hypothetical protein
MNLTADILSLTAQTWDTRISKVSRQVRLAAMPLITSILPALVGSGG